MADLLARLADRLDPAPLPVAAATPLGFMEAASRNTRRRYRHLELIEEAVLEAIDTGGRVIISVSVRHGKSELCSRYLPAWFLGRYPDKRVILATHGVELARDHSRVARDLLTEYGHDIFATTVSTASAAAGRWDIDGHQGGLVCVGVGGAPTGRGAELIVIDDPYPNFEKAMSPLFRQRVKDWWTGTMASRINPGGQGRPDGAVVLIMARWHEDDLAGWLLKNAPDEWKELRLPAIADSANDPMGRQIGEALWPEWYPLEVLERRHREVTADLGEQVWLGQFQGTPRSPTGGMFPEDCWRFIDHLGEFAGHVVWCRSWDLAYTEDGGDWTVGALIGAVDDGRWIIADIVRGQWGADEMNAQLRLAARNDPPGTYIELPQDPGAGKNLAGQLVRMLAGYNVSAHPHFDSKDVRAVGLSAQQRAGNVMLLVADWNGLLVDEMRAFPKGNHDDMVDAVAYGFNYLLEPDDIEETYEGDDELRVHISQY
jgi:predicted phage terminase large subunit-like protein